jgi:mRNA-degrading endonuclease RelE of RelBE toxin-antitoxin system
MSRILWTPKAVKQLRKLKNAAAQERIYTEIQTLAEFPKCANVKKLTNAAHDYRLRVGDYRVLFSVDDGIRIITIEEVKKRDERTY